MTPIDALLNDFCSPARTAGLHDAAKGFALEDWHFEGLTLRRAVSKQEGPCVLVLHGWGSGGQHMLGLARAIARTRARPVVIDFPAHGASAGGQTTMVQCGRLISHLIDELNPAGICAHSFGAMAAAMVCAGHPYFGGEAHPDLKLAMVSTGFSLDWQIQRHCRAQGLSAEEEAALRALIEDRFDIDIAKFHLETAAASLPVHTHVFHDEEDPIIDIAFIRAILAKAPHAALTVTQGSGHDRILLDRTVLRAAAAFFAE